MGDVHAGYVVTLTTSAPDRPVKLLAGPTSTEVAVDLYFAIDGSKADLRRLLHRETGKLSAPARTYKETAPVDAGAEKLWANVVHKEKWEEHTRSTTLARIHYTLFSTCHA